MNRFILSVVLVLMFVTQLSEAQAGRLLGSFSHNRSTSKDRFHLQTQFHSIRHGKVILSDGSVVIAVARELGSRKVVPSDHNARSILT